MSVVTITVGLTRNKEDKAMETQKSTQKKEPKPQLTPRERDQLIRDYRNGATRALLMFNYAISSSTFYSIVKGVEQLEDATNFMPDGQRESEIVRTYKANKRQEFAVLLMDMKGSTSNYIKGMAMAENKTEAEVIDDLVDFKKEHNG